MKKYTRDEKINYYKLHIQVCKAKIDLAITQLGIYEKRLNRVLTLPEDKSQDWSERVTSEIEKLNS